MIPTELIPGIFEPISLYWGIALLLIYAGIINQKISKYSAVLTDNEVFNTSVKTTNNTDISNEIGEPEVKETVKEGNVVTKDSK